MNLNSLFAARPKPLAQIGIWAAAIVVTGLVGYLRMNSPASHEFHLFFLLPIAAVAWFISLPRAAMLAVLAAVLWYLAERQLSAGGLERAPLLFNTLQRLVLLVGFAWLLDRLRKGLGQQP